MSNMDKPLQKKSEGRLGAERRATVTGILIAPVVFIAIATKRVDLVFGIAFAVLATIDLVCSAQLARRKLAPSSMWGYSTRGKLIQGLALAALGSMYFAVEFQPWWGVFFAFIPAACIYFAGWRVEEKARASLAGAA